MTRVFLNWDDTYCTVNDFKIDFSNFVQTWLILLLSIWSVCHMQQQTKTHDNKNKALHHSSQSWEASYHAFISDSVFLRLTVLHFHYCTLICVILLDTVKDRIRLGLRVNLSSPIGQCWLMEQNNEFSLWYILEKINQWSHFSSSNFFSSKYIKIKIARYLIFFKNKRRVGLCVMCYSVGFVTIFIS